MQRRVIKILIILAISFFGSCELSLAQVSTYRLKQADSLFQIKQYVQSLEQYQTILLQKQYTNSMFLKMAFIQEGLGHIGSALYYLNLYYISSHDQSVSDKMEELAAKYNLTGYEYTDRHKVYSWYQEYRIYLSFAFTALAIFLLSVVIFLKQSKRSVILTSVFLTVVLAGFLLHVNMGKTLSSGIISDNHTYIMSGPSSGADVVTVIDEGHRFDVIGKTDVWLKIKWNGEIAFVKENNLRLLIF